MNFDSTSNLYLGLTVVCLVITVYLQQTNKNSREVMVAGACFVLMLTMFITKSTGSSETSTQKTVYNQLFNQPLPAVPSSNSGTEYYYSEPEQDQPLPPKQKDVQRTEESLDDVFKPLVDQSKLENQNIYEAKNIQLTAEQLLPNTDNEWGQLQSLVDVGLKDQNFLTPRSTGINTIAQSHKNPCYDLRGTIPNPKVGHMPWGNSSIDGEELNNQLQLNMKLN